MNYLVKETTYFYDGHGCPDEGGIKLSITNNKKYDNLDPNKEYDDSLNEVLDDQDDSENPYPEDGYNCTRGFIRFKPISNEEAAKAQEIINGYELLLKSF